jgi:hypothetical protein
VVPDCNISVERRSFCLGEPTDSLGKFFFNRESVERWVRLERPEEGWTFTGECGFKLGGLHCTFSRMGPVREEVHTFALGRWKPQYGEFRLDGKKVEDWMEQNQPGEGWAFTGESDFTGDVLNCTYERCERPARADEGPRDAAGHLFVPSSSPSILTSTQLKRRLSKRLSCSPERPPRPVTAVLATAPPRLLAPALAPVTVPPSHVFSPKQRSQAAQTAPSTQKPELLDLASADGLWLATGHSWPPSPNGEPAVDHLLLAFGPSRTKKTIASDSPGFVIGCSRGEDEPFAVHGAVAMLPGTGSIHVAFTQTYLDDNEDVFTNWEAVLDLKSGGPPAMLGGSWCADCHTMPRITMWFASAM